MTVHPSWDRLETDSATEAHFRMPDYPKKFIPTSINARAFVEANLEALFPDCS